MLIVFLEGRSIVAEIGSYIGVVTGPLARKPACVHAFQPIRRLGPLLNMVTSEIRILPSEDLDITPEKKYYDSGRPYHDVQCLYYYDDRGPDYDTHDDPIMIADDVI